MPYLPAFCDKCGLVFPGMNVPSRAVRFRVERNFVNCPRCGWMQARVLEGTMNVFEDTIQILRGTNATPAQFARLRELLQNAQQKQQPPEEVAAAVKRELPNFGALAKQLLVPKTPADFYSLLLVLIALTERGDHPTTVYEDRSVHQTAVQVSPAAPAQAVKATPAQSPKPAPTAKPGRTDPCPCGSGKKYKHCCGAVR
jgi:hypothetical protein